MRFFRNCVFSFLLLILIPGCKPDMIRLRFEVITTVPVAPPYPGITTKIGLGTGQQHNDFTSGTNWSYELNTDSEYRPLQVVLNAGNIPLASEGSVTVNIYVNGEKKATSTAVTTQYGNQFIANTNVISHTIN